MPKQSTQFDDTVSNWSSRLRRDEKEKHPEPESFETQQYSEPNLDAIQNTFEVLKQISMDTSWGVYRSGSPSQACGIKLMGNTMQVFYHSYEMSLPQNIKRVRAEAELGTSNYVKYLKAEFKAKCGRTLGLKELKEQSGELVEKVSLNERYYFKFWRVFELK